MSFFNDLYVYLINKGTWRRVTSPNSPLPRSGHAICRGSNGLIYVSMGEFSSPKQGTFHHYNDFWSLDPNSREWTHLDSKGKTPPARSGHRMVAYKDYIILFGGFSDTSQQTRYLQDLWVYDTRNFVWHSPDKLAQKPDPRSSFSLLPHENGAVLFGGYSRVKVTTKAGNQTKGGGQATRNILKPVVYQDSWMLKVTAPSKEAPAKTPPGLVWERRKKPANAPNPPRAGSTMVWHKGRGISFGGVHDVENSEDGIESEFFDSLFVWNIDRNRFFPVTLRRARNNAKKAQTGSDRGGRRGRGKADEEELLKNLAALNAQGTVSGADAMEVDVQDSASEDEEDPLAAQPVSMIMPHPRFNAQLAVYGDMLFIYGGTYEKGDQEFTFDEMHAIDLVRLDGVKQIFRREFEAWIESDEEEDSEGEDGEDSDEDGEDSEGAAPSAKDDVQSVTTAVGSVVSEQTLVEVEVEEAMGSALSDDKPHPRPFESLRDFFFRTSIQWQEILLENIRRKDGAMAANKSVKELRKEAFMIAEDKWWDCREEISALEDAQEDAGIGEVVSLADRGDQGGVTGRRR